MKNTAYVIKGRRNGLPCFDTVEVRHSNLLPKYDTESARIAIEKAKEQGLEIDETRDIFLTELKAGFLLSH